MRLKKHDDYNEFSNKQNKNIKIKQTDPQSKKKSVVERKKVILCGDSLLNNVDGNGLSSKKDQVVVRNFPGATSRDMIDYIKPLINKKPSKLIIHIGTNDITNGIDTVENLNVIQNLVENTSSNTEIVMSQAVKRSDKPGMSEKIKLLNTKLKSFCTEKKS